jgi:catechol 2,3-dioxygenase-like lactoylglutathione lyase family enzyme
MEQVPRLDGVHHVKLPVSDLARSLDWYRTRLGYEVEIEFVEHGALMGLALRHPNGGPRLGLRLDPERARAAAGFDYFAIGVPDKQALEAVAERLRSYGERNAGIHFATIGWILPGTHDPDGHEVRLYTTQHHTEPDEPIVSVDPVQTSAAREAAYEAGRA